MKLAVPKETVDGERRVAATPETCGKLKKAGFEIFVENGAGEARSSPTRSTGVFANGFPIH